MQAHVNALEGMHAVSIAWSSLKSTLKFIIKLLNSKFFKFLR